MLIVLGFFCSHFTACSEPETALVEIILPEEMTEYAGGEEVVFEVRIENFAGVAAKVYWSFGDGATAAGVKAVHAFDTKGTYEVTVVVTNEYEEIVYDSISVCITSSRYEKLDEVQNALPDDATAWSVVYDTRTGLFWEVKQDHDFVKNYANPHDADNTYTWFDSNPDTNGGHEGADGNGTDTEDFIVLLNEESFGGFADWRLPTYDELTTIFDSQRFNPAINTIYFPETVSWYYWSATTYPEQVFSYAACHISFMGSPSEEGAFPNQITTQNHYGDKDLFYHVRAVRDDETVEWR